ncbi:MAG: DNA polymerase III subunit delta [Clostridia bacterium]|nr:DNA polymerase III subunit delta [Clostridia bacterium]
MPKTEQDLKQRLNDETLSPLWFLYGEEPYLVSHYAGLIADKAAPLGDLAAFNRHVFDGTSLDLNQLEAAVQALPLMGDYTCVWVRDYDAGAASASTTERMKAIVSSVAAPTLLLFSVTAFIPDMKKNAKWKAFLSLIEKRGEAVCFTRRSPAEIGRLLCRGAAKRGCTMQPAVASGMIEQCGADLMTLLGELDKLCAVAGSGGEITAEMVKKTAVRQLEASVYELSKALLRRNYSDAYDCIAALFALGEEPIRILAVLSESYVDLYRAKLAAAAGKQAESLAADFSYRGREFRLRNAARDSRGMSLQALRRCLKTLAQADTTMKSTGSAHQRLILEETAAKLVLIAKTGR